MTIQSETIQSEELTGAIMAAIGGIDANAIFATERAKHLRVIAGDEAAAEKYAVRKLNQTLEEAKAAAIADFAEAATKKADITEKKKVSAIEKKTAAPVVIDAPHFVHERLDKDEKGQLHDRTVIAGINLAPVSYKTLVPAKVAHNKVQELAVNHIDDKLSIDQTTRNAGGKWQKFVTVKAENGATVRECHRALIQAGLRETYALWVIGHAINTGVVSLSFKTKG